MLPSWRIDKKFKADEKPPEPVSSTVSMAVVTMLHTAMEDGGTLGAHHENTVEYSYGKSTRTVTLKHIKTKNGIKKRIRDTSNE